MQFEWNQQCKENLSRFLRCVRILLVASHFFFFFDNISSINNVKVFFDASFIACLLKSERGNNLLLSDNLFDNLNQVHCKFMWPTYITNKQLVELKTVTHQ